MAKIFSLCWIVLMMTGCAATPTEIEFYVLNKSPQGGGGSVENKQTTQALVIESVEVASYLRQTGLVLQTAPHQLQISHSHLWAEPLEDAIPKTLLSNLQQLSSEYNYYLKNYDWVTGEHYRLRLRIESLHATIGGEVICSGRFQVVDSLGSRVPLMRDFSFQRVLLEDGYAHAVAQLEQLLAQVADDILNAMETHYSSAEKL